MMQNPIAILCGRAARLVWELVRNPENRVSHDTAHILPWFIVELPEYNMSRVMKKTFFYICENKDADQLRGNREADQRLGFRYKDSTIPLLPTYEISRF